MANKLEEEKRTRFIVFLERDSTSSSCCFYMDLLDKHKKNAYWVAKIRKHKEFDDSWRIIEVVLA